MEEKNENEMLTHFIVIDEFMSLEWKIPKVITPLQLKAMSSRVNKLFNLSEVPIGDNQPVAVSKKQYGGSHWTPELKQKVVDLYNQGEKAIPIAKILHETTGDNYFLQSQVVHQQLNYLKKVRAIIPRRQDQNDNKVIQ